MLWLLRLCGCEDTHMSNICVYDGLWLQEGKHESESVNEIINEA